MIVNNKEEFDSAIASSSGIETIIQLPEGIINWNILIDNVCEVKGNNTIIDVSGLGLESAVEVRANAIISQLRIVNDVGHGLYAYNCSPNISQVFANCDIAYKLENINGGTFESLDATNSNIGFKLLNVRNSTFSACDAHDNRQIGWDIVGSSKVVGDIYYYNLGLEINGTDLTPLTDSTDYYFIINGIEYSINSGVNSTYNSIVNLLNSIPIFKDAYIVVLANKDLRFTSTLNAINITAGVSGDDLLSNLSATGSTGQESFDTRTDRTHHNNFYSVFSYESNTADSIKQTGIRFINADNNIFDDCSKIYDNTNSGIIQMPNSFLNSFAGEIYGNSPYGVKNFDTVGGDHDFNARGTWWGHITGPSGMGPGQGDRITSNVLYQPWAQNGTQPELPYPKTREWIWGMLGSPLTRVELTEGMISEDIEVAIEKYLYYWDPEPGYMYLTVSPFQQEIMLPLGITKRQVMDVVYQPFTDIFQALSGSGESFFLTYYLQHTGGSFLSDFYIAMSYKETFEKTLGLFPTYEFISKLTDSNLPYNPSTNPYRDFLRIYPKPSGGIKVGLQVSRIPTEEEIDIIMWIRKYALTYSKERLGRIRGKFGSVPGPTGEIQLNGAELLAESQQERENLLRDLIQRSTPLGFIVG